MRSRFRPRLSFANVMSSIAVFAALGGGYAVAFSGSGTLQKSALDSISAHPTFQTARTLNGFGTLQVSCGTNEVIYRLHNPNSTSISLRVFNKRTQVDADEEVLSGGNSSEYQADSQYGEMEFHLSKLSPFGNDGKKAQVAVWASSQSTAACPGHRVRVLALNTQE